jgi:hypothetical protein
MFERFVARAPSRARRLVFVVSVALHVAAAVALVVLSVFHVSELAPPPLAIVFMSPPPPPAGSPSGGATTPPRKKPRSSPARPTLTQPAPQVQPQPPRDSPPAVDEGPEDTGDNGGGPGDANGPGGNGPGGPGIPGGTGTQPIASLPPRKPINVPPHQLDAQRIAGNDPHLPPRMIQDHVGEHFAFMARMCIDQSGRVMQIGVVRGIPGADEAIVDELRRWRYRPQPLPVCFIADFTFDIQK